MSCGWPRCSCKATGVYCSSKPSGKKAVTPIAKQSAKAKSKVVDTSLLHNNDGAFYLEIWQERAHICFECGKPIEGMMSNLYMHHVLAKKKSIHEYNDYSIYRHCKWNIVILDWPHHTSADADNAPKVYEYKQRLIEMHNNGELQKISPDIQFIENGK